MSNWPRYPTIYEINTWVWLTELSASSGNPVTLSSVPEAEWDALAAHGFDAVWLMGVWERSPAGIAIANRNQNLLNDFKRALPDFRQQDNVGSPYCVRRYVVDGQLGGPEGLAAARRELAKRDIRLILDFVPNHVAPDHPWAIVHPDYFIQGNLDDAKNDPASFINSRRTCFRMRTRSLFSGLAGCAATECLPARASSGRARNRFEHRRPVRRHSLRHGDAAAQFDLRTHLGQPCGNDSRQRNTGVT